MKANILCSQNSKKNVDEAFLNFSFIRMRSSYSDSDVKSIFLGINRKNLLLERYYIAAIISKQVKPIGFEAPRGGAYDNRKHLKLEAPCS